MHLAVTPSGPSLPISNPSNYTCEEVVRPVITVTFEQAHLCEPNVSGFLHLWALYVTGFDERFHCQRALRGSLSARIKTQSTPPNTEIQLTESKAFDSIYLCGVSRGPVASRSKNNLHLALEPKLGVEFAHRAYNGYVVSIKNATPILIPELPKSWNGLPDSYTRCCNFRFGVYRFGYSMKRAREV